MTVLLLMDFVPLAGATPCLHFLRAHHEALFPRLLHQSPFHRRARRLAALVARMRRDGIHPLGATQATRYLRDTKPLPVGGYQRSKRRSNFVATADYGVCPRRPMKYFGYKWVLLCTRDGVPVRYALGPASTSERVAAEEVRDYVWHVPISADQGFLGADGQRGYQEIRYRAILTPVRSNQRPVRLSGRPRPGATGSANGSRARTPSGRIPADTGSVSCAKSSTAG